MGGLAKQENLHATIEDWKGEMERELANYADKSDDVKKYFDENQSRILNRITEEKVMKILKGKC